MTRSHTIDAARLLAETHFLRQLATHLVGRSDADDLTQEVLAAATSHTAPADLDRRWLAGVARKIAAFRLRGNARRRRREQLAARDDAVASTADLVQRAEMQRMLADAVNALPESLRDVVVLRFHEELPPRDVAKRLGVPVNTVRSRTRRAIDRLRADLDASHGDRRTWVSALAPLAMPRAATLFSVAHTLRRSAAALVVVALSVGGWLAFDAPAPVPPSFEQRGDVTSIFASSGTDAGSAPARVAVPKPSAPAPGIAGRVVDTEGNPVAEATVYLGSLDWYRALERHEPARARARDAKTDSAGRFTLPDPASAGIAFHSGRVEIGEPLHDGFVATHAETLWDADEEPVIVMRRLLPVRLEVEVVDELGVPVPMFRVSAWSGWKSETAPNGYRSRMALREVRGSGGMLTGDIHAVEGVPFHVSVDCPGHGNSSFGPRASLETHVLREEFVVERDAVLRVRFDVDLQLAERVAERTTSGRFLDAETRQPIAGVELRMRTDGWFEKPRLVRRNQTRVDGTFRIARPSDRNSGRLRAEHPAYDPVEVEADRDELGDILLVKRGMFGCTVVDAAGDPIPGMPFLFRTVDGSVHERGRTDRTGRIAFADLVSARYHVYLLADPMDSDDDAIASDSFAVEAGKALDARIVVDDLETFPVSGVVVAPFDTPIVPVFLPIGRGGGWVVAKPRGHGNFDAGGMRRGEYLVALVPADDGDRDTPSALLPPMAVDGFAARGLEFRWPASSIRGRIVLPAGASLDGLRVVAYPAMPAAASPAITLVHSSAFATRAGTVPDPDGTFRVPHVANAPVVVELRRENAVVARRRVDVGGDLDLGDWNID